jgi:hypothetical protein
MADLFVVAARIAGIGHISDYVGGNEVAQKAVIAKIASRRCGPFGVAAWRMSRRATMHRGPCSRDCLGRGQPVPWGLK